MKRIFRSLLSAFACAVLSPSLALALSLEEIPQECAQYNLFVRNLARVAHDRMIDADWGDAVSVNSPLFQVVRENRFTAAEISVLQSFVRQLAIARAQGASAEATERMLQRQITGIVETRQSRIDTALRRRGLDLVCAPGASRLAEGGCSGLSPDADVWIVREVRLNPRFYFSLGMDADLSRVFTTDAEFAVVSVEEYLRVRGSQRDFASRDVVWHSSGRLSFEIFCHPTSFSIDDRLPTQREVHEGIRAHLAQWRIAPNLAGGEVCPE